MNYDSPDIVWICNYSNEKYKGKCPVTSCWANHKKSNGGCIYTNFATNKLSLSIEEIAFVLKADETEIEDDIADSKQLLQVLLYFSERLDEIKIEPKPHCEFCGIGNSNGLACLNLSQCRKRITTYEALNKEPIITAIGITKHWEFWRLLNKNPDHRHNLLSELGLDQKEKDKLEALLKNSDAIRV